MQTPFTYVVTSVDKPANHMTVVYSTDGKQSISVGLPLPYDSVTAFIEANAPLSQWAVEGRLPMEVTVGLAGAYTPPVAAVGVTITMQSVVV